MHQKDTKEGLTLIQYGGMFCNGCMLEKHL